MPEGAFVDGIRVWEWPGAPPDTLLLHGIGNYGRYWDLFAGAVAGRLRLVAPDARGHGESRKPDTGYAPVDFVGDAVAVMDALRIERALVVGHSMGGLHAAAVALAHPERVGALVLVDVGPREPDAPRIAQSRARRLSLERPDRFGTDADALAYLRETSPGYGDAVYENRMRWLFDRDERGLVWRSARHALRQILDTADGEAVWSRVTAVACPVLVVRGTRSPAFTHGAAARLVGSLRDAALVELDAAHNVALDRPDELAGAVVRFARERP